MVGLSDYRSSVKIDELPSSTSLDGTETIVLTSSGVTKKSLVSKIKDYLQGTGEFVSASDFISATANKGSSLITYLAFGTGAVGRSVRSKLGDWVSVKDYGAVGDGVTDDTVAINKALATGSDTVIIPAGTYKVSGTLLIPVYTTLIGNGRDTVITPSSSGVFTSNFVVMYNSTTGSGWTTAYPAGPTGGVRNLCFDNTSGPDLAKMIFTAGAVTIEDVMFIQTEQSIVTTGLYDDMVSIIRTFCDRPRSTSWQIEIGQLGDGLTIQSPFFNTYDTTKNNHIRVINSQGGTIRQAIQGNIRLQGCDGVTIENAHLEVGSIAVNSSNVIIKDCYLWAQASTPSIDVVNTSTLQWTTVKVENTSFPYNSNTGVLGFFGEDIRVDNGSHLVVDNCRRRPIGANIEIISNTGIRIARADNTEITDWSFYSNKLSVRGEVRPGYFVPLNLKYYGPDSTTGIFISIQAGSSTWLKTTGTYYYRAVKVLDAQRRVGKNDTSERSLSLTNGVDGALLVLNTGYTDGYIRIYRGTSPGIYDNYVDIPLINSKYLYDNGDLINGHAWIARSPDIIDSFYDATAIEISNQNVKVTGPSKPTQGVWALGDEFKYKSPASGGFVGAIYANISGTPGWFDYGAIT